MAKMSHMAKYHQIVTGKLHKASLEVEKVHGGEMKMEDIDCCTCKACVEYKRALGKKEALYEKAFVHWMKCAKTERVST